LKHLAVILLRHCEPHLTVQFKTIMFEFVMAGFIPAIHVLRAEPQALRGWPRQARPRPKADSSETIRF
jgi:hypothetical protein